MITIEMLFTQIAGLQRDDLDRWIANQWVRPQTDSGAVLFAEIDIARIRLIRDLRDDLDIDEAVLPVVLSLLDQLYDHRRRLHALCDAINDIAPDELRQRLAAHLMK